MGIGRDLPSADSFPHDSSNQGWTRLKERARSFSWASRVGRDPRIWAIFHCFLRCISRELDLNWNSSDSNQCPYGVTAL